MTAAKDGRFGEKFLDMQALVGISKHTGGFAATDELLALCHAPDAREVLDAGCGTGVGPVHIARTYGCRVVGVDISEKMIAWARQRAREARVEATSSSGPPTFWRCRLKTTGSMWPSASPCWLSWRTSAGRFGSSCA